MAMSSIELTVRVRDERKPHPASVRRLLDLARQWDRWADEYDAQAHRQSNPLIVCQLTAWAQAYRNAAALLVLTVQPRPKLIGRCADAR